MKKIIFLIFILLLASTGAFFLLKNPGKTPGNKEQKSNRQETSMTDYFYPIDNFSSRINLKSFGQYVKAGDEKTEACGRAFVGYHTGDDLEVTATELNKAVPVKAIAGGKVRQTGTVSGYGGLVVIEHTLANQTVTAYYGHLNINSVKVKTGQRVSAGQTIGELGQACSVQTDYERKHLHFSLHRGTALDVRGYVPTTNELNAWLNPRQTFANLKAQ